jgi:hypothetical protein
MTSAHFPGLEKIQPFLLLPFPICNV